jgi:hypothetical protein
MKPISIEVGGKSYKLSRLDTTILEKAVAWADKVLPDPMDVVREQIKGFPPEIQLELVKEAQQTARLRKAKSPNSPDIQALLNSAEGIKKCLALMVQKHQPDLSDDDALKLIVACEEEHGLAYVKDALEQCNTSEEKPASK